MCNNFFFYKYSVYVIFNFLFFVAEKELVEFLAEEIVAEKKARKLKTIPTDLYGFKVSLDGAEVRLVKEETAET